MSTIDGTPFIRRMFGCKDRVVPDGRTLGEVVADIVGEQCGGHAAVWDGFCGSAYCGMIFKRRGFRVVSSDIRPSAWLRGSALVQANSPAISASEAEELAKASPKAKGWFTANKLPLINANNSAWLDAMAEVLPGLSVNAQTAVAMGINWAVETLLQRGSRFLHIKYSLYDDILCGGWHMRDKSLAAEWLRFMVEDYPKLLSDNGKHNECHMGDTVALASGIVADAAYFDPPYAAQFSSYQGNYDIVDDWPGILLGKALPPEPEGKPHLRFSSPESAVASFATLMERARHIPLWVISYSDSDTMRVSPEEIAFLAEAEGRATEILRFPFPRARVIKGQSGVTYNECIISCRAGLSGKPSRKKDDHVPGLAGAGPDNRNQNKKGDA